MIAESKLFSKELPEADIDELFPEGTKVMFLRLDTHQDKAYTASVLLNLLIRLNIENTHLSKPLVLIPDK
jgi:hypothetical protein